MNKWNLIFDADRCNSCNNCVLATKDEYLSNRFEGYSEPAPTLGDLWFTLKRNERGKAPMIDVNHSISKRKDGIVVINPKKAKGNKDLVSTCPYGHIYWNEEEQIAQKWSFDAHLLDGGWKEPRCSQICPTEALKAVKISDPAMQALAQQEGLVHPPAENNAKSRLWYKNLESLTHSFLGGTLVRIKDGAEHCLEGQTIELIRDGAVVATERSDAFGDFKFDYLEGNGETYHLRILSPEDKEHEIKDVTLEDNRYLGVIEL